MILVVLMLGSGLVLLLTVPTARASPVLLQGTFTRLIVDPTQARAYIGDAANGALIVWNTSVDAPVASIPLGAVPKGMDLSPDGSRLYAALPARHVLAVIDLTTRSVTADIPISSAPFDVAASANGLAFVTTSDYFGYARVVNLTQGKEVGNVTVTGPLYQNSMAKVDPTRTVLFLGVTGLTPASMFKLHPTANNATLLSASPFFSLGDTLVDAAPIPGGQYIFLAGIPVYRFPNPYYVELMNTTTWTVVEALNAAPYPSTVSYAPGPGIVVAGDFSNSVGNPDVAAYAVPFINAGASVDAFGTMTFSQAATWVRITPDAQKAYAITEDVYGNENRFEVLPVSSGAAVTSGTDGNGYAIAAGGNTPSPSMRFTFTTIVNLTTLGYLCRADGAPFTTCSSPATVSGLSPGAHTFQVSVVTPTWTSPPATFAWTMLTPAGTVQDLINQVNALRNSDYLTATQTSALLKPLNAALTALNAGKTSPAIDDLKTFLATVRNDVKKGILTPTQAAPLTSEACDLVLVLGGTC